MIEQRCECPSTDHGHKPNECHKAATREDKRCDDCRDAGVEEAVDAVRRLAGSGRMSPAKRKVSKPAVKHRKARWIPAPKARRAGGCQILSRLPAWSTSLRAQCNEDASLPRERPVQGANSALRASDIHGDCLT